MIYKVITLMLLLVTTASAQHRTNPFLEGISPVEIPDLEWEALKDKALATPKVLERNIKRNSALNAAYSNPRLFSEIKSTVIRSWEKRGRVEALSRIALNQALELTYGVPSSDGESVQQPGVFSQRTYSDVVKQILMDSLKLAIEYCPEDRDSYDSFALTHLPFAPFMQRKLELSLEWRMHLMTEKEEIAFLRTTTKHIYNLLNNENVLIQSFFAEEITELEVLSQSVKNVRELRSDFLRIADQIFVKIKKSRLEHTSLWRHT